ncbi:MAG: hypothetical protein H7Y20_03890 [Bryobacteraceae bacterium]|nr:hypothetical protein [Bryobacteraceae bacterium]
MARTPACILFIALLAAGFSRAEEQGQLDYSPVLFSVMAAWDAAHASADNVPADPFRSAVRQAVLGKNPAVLADLRRYFHEHKKPDPGADLAQYFSFSLVAGEAPDFKLKLTGIEVPPDVQQLSGFAELMARFYAEADIVSLWKELHTPYEKALEEFQEPVSRTLLEANGYLRNPTSGYMGRRFFVVLDLMAPSSQVQTRSYKDDYYVVVTPPASARVDDVRHAYLHYLLDPLATKYSERLQRVRGLLDYAQGAPALEENYKNDFMLLATESLIKAVESRLTRRPAMVQEALKDGFVLAPYFAEILPAYEKQPVAMRLYLPDMLDAIDLRKEDKRLRTVEFSTAKAVRQAPVVSRPDPQQSSAEKLLDEADKLYSGRADLDGAREAYLKIVRQTEDKAVQSRAYFGLGRVAALKNEPELADQLFRKTLELAPDPHTRSWTEVYLARIAEGYGDAAQAQEHYKAALAVEGAPPGARQAAEKGVQKVEKR